MCMNIFVLLCPPPALPTPISFLMVRPLCGNIVPGWLSVPRTRLIVLFPEVVDRQISGMPWRSCHKHIVYKHENAL